MRFNDIDNVKLFLELTVGNNIFKSSLILTYAHQSRLSEYNNNNV